MENIDETEQQFSVDEQEETSINNVTFKPPQARIASSFSSTSSANENESDVEENINNNNRNDDTGDDETQQEEQDDGFPPGGDVTAAAPGGGVVPRGGGDDDDDDDDEANNMANENETPEERESRLLREENEWTYTRPPDNRNSFDFFESGTSMKPFCTFSSDLCSGNLARVERTVATKFDLFLANDGMGGPHPTNNKSWFYFSVTGVPHGTTLTFTIQQVPFVKTYIYGYSPVVAVDPSPNALLTSSNNININNVSGEQQSSSTPFVLPKAVGGAMIGSKQFTRIPGPFVTVTPAPVPAHIQAIRDEKERQAKFDALVKEQQQEAKSGNASAKATSSSPTTSQTPPSSTTNSKKKDNPNPEYCHISFDYTFDAVLKVRDSNNPLITLASEVQPQFTYYFAFCHPYPYQKLQRHLSVWNKNFGPSIGIINNNNKDDETVTVSAKNSVGNKINSIINNNNNNSNNSSKKFHPVMYRELLTKTLDGHRVDMITITARGNFTDSETAPFFGPSNCLPILQETAQSPTLQSIKTNSNLNQGNSRAVPSDLPKNRRYVLLSARVHPGEVPASHVMHGCIEFLLNTEDPRAIALRENFIFVVVPMINPDGVVRGHTRADSTGTNLNRMYKSPSPKRHPAVWALRQLMLHLAAATPQGLALYVDMHAHANKRGAFFYGNAMDAPRMVENLLWAKLVSLNSPYLMFNDCNFTTTNMYSMGKTGVCRDGSSRVTAFLETSLVNSYTLECNSLVGPTSGGNCVVGLCSLGDTSTATSGGLAGKVANVELEDRTQGLNTPKYYTPSSTFHDIGRAMLVSLLDLHGLNPLCRLPLMPEFKNLTNLRNFISAAIYNDAIEQSRKKRMSLFKNALCDAPTTSSQGVTDNNNNNNNSKRRSMSEENEAVAAFLTGPVNSTIGPRAFIPPTTTTSAVMALQSAAQKYQTFSSSVAATGAGGAFARKSALPPPHLRKALANNNNGTSTVLIASNTRKSSSTSNNTSSPTMRKQTTTSSSSSSSVVMAAVASGNSNSSGVVSSSTALLVKKNSFTSSSSSSNNTSFRKRSVSANNIKENSK